MRTTLCGNTRVFIHRYRLSPPFGGLNRLPFSFYELYESNENDSDQFISRFSISFIQPQNVVMSGVRVLMLMRCVLKMMQF